VDLCSKFGDLPGDADRPKDYDDAAVDAERAVQAMRDERRAVNLAAARKAEELRAVEQRIEEKLRQERRAVEERQEAAAEKAAAEERAARAAAAADARQEEAALAARRGAGIQHVPAHSSTSINSMETASPWEGTVKTSVKRRIGVVIDFNEELCPSVGSDDSIPRYKRHYDPLLAARIAEIRELSLMARVEDCIRYGNITHTINEVYNFNDGSILEHQTLIPALNWSKDETSYIRPGKSCRFTSSHSETRCLSCPDYLNPQLGQLGICGEGGAKKCVFLVDSTCPTSLGFGEQNCPVVICFDKPSKYDDIIEAFKSNFGHVARIPPSGSIFAICFQQMLMWDSAVEYVQGI
jgi:hypothetical protein